MDGEKTSIGGVWALWCKDFLWRFESFKFFNGRYELLIGITPFYHSNPNVMFELITESEIKFPSRVSISDEAKDLISKVHLVYNKINQDNL